MSEASLLGCVPFSGRRSGRALAAGILLATAGCSPRGDGGAATDKDIVRRSALGVSIDAQWLPAGPGSMSDNFVLTLAGFNGDGTPIFSSTSTGAVNSIVAHPSDVNTLYVGAVNGGVWRTHNATAPQPDWAPLTDFLPSLATGVLGMDPTNPLVLAAGTGNYSNFLGVTKLDGAGYVYITSDGGDHWTTIADPSVRGENLSSIHILGARILVSATDGPIFRRATAGDVFVQSDSGIPSYNTVYSMVGDRTTPGVSRFYAAVRGQGIYLSENDGVSWVRASNGPLQQALANPDLSWAKLAVGTTGRVAVTVATGPDVAFVGFSDNRGGTWTALDVPRFPVVSQGQPVPPAAIQSFSADASNRLIINTAAPHNLPIGFHVRIAGVTGNPVSGRDVNADWTAVGVPDPNGQKFALRDPITGEDALSSGNAASGGTFQPWVSVNSGGQAGNVGIAIDPANSKFIYLGGDKQADIIGGFTAIVRANVTIAADNGIPSSQWTSIVATGTGNGTSPHPDTRAFAFDAQGSLLVVNDCGAYRRIDPQSQTGDWQSLNSTLETAEQHDIAVDPETGLAASGNQDNGVTAQRPGPTPRQWQTVIRGDGGDVHFLRRPTQSERWASVQSLICLSKTPVAAGIDLSGFQPPALCISGPCNSRCTTPPADLQGSTIYEAEPLPFLTRFAMNQAALDANPTGPERLVIAAGQAIYESRDSGQNVSSIGGPPNTIDLVYGTPANPDALWAVARSNPPVWRRLTPNGPLTAATTPPELAPQTFLNGGVAMDPAQPASAYVVAGTQVFSTNDGGASWNDVTGDLTPSSCGVTKASRPNLIYSIVLVPSPTFGNRIFIGADGGVFMSAASEPTIWTLVSGTMAHAPVIDLEYDNGNGRDTLNAGTLGRGTWKMQNASRINRPPVATCRDQFLIADATCHASIPANQFDGGSIDPEGDAALAGAARGRDVRTVRSQRRVDHAARADRDRQLHDTHRHGRGHRQHRSDDHPAEAGERRDGRSRIRDAHDSLDGDRRRQLVLRRSDRHHPAGDLRDAVDRSARPRRHPAARFDVGDHHELRHRQHPRRRHGEDRRHLEPRRRHDRRPRDGLRLHPVGGRGTARQPSVGRRTGRAQHADHVPSDAGHHDDLPGQPGRRPRRHRRPPHADARVLWARERAAQRRPGVGQRPVLDPGPRPRTPVSHDGLAIDVEGARQRAQQRHHARRRHRHAVGGRFSHGVSRHAGGGAGAAVHRRVRGPERDADARRDDVSDLHRAVLRAQHRVAAR